MIAKFRRGFSQSWAWLWRPTMEQAAHQRAMELKHGWRPVPATGSNGPGLALAGIAIATGLAVAGLAVGIGMSDPQAWVAAYQELTSFVDARNALAAR